MISTLLGKDIFKDISGKSGRYSYETTISMRLLMVILKVGEKTCNSCWIQGSDNQALYFVDDILLKTEDLCVKHGIDPTIITSNLNHILHMTGNLSIRREYGKRTVGVGLNGGSISDHSEIDEIFEAFNMAGLQRYIRDNCHNNMCAISGYMYKRVLAHCSDVGVWDEDDDLAFRELIEKHLCIFYDRPRYITPVRGVLNNIFR